MVNALVIAGTHSGVGKTTVTMGLLSALKRRGMIAQGFKVGPDFIDPGFHSAVTGRPAYNLDGWMLDPDTNREIFATAAAGADVAVVEGMMGLFDGASGAGESGSTSEMAKCLNIPVVLVIDATAQARSAAALVHGFETFDPALRVVAVVANNVAGEGHYRYLRDAIGGSCRAELIGWLPRNAEAELPSRHLGLVTAAEALSKFRADVLAEWLEKGIDLDRLLELSAAGIAESAAPIDQANFAQAAGSDAPLAGPKVRIGVARDRAFCFYYESNLKLLEQSGATLVTWSPMDDPLPDGLHGLYFGGGYPELYAARLSANAQARSALAAFIEQGGAVYAECGGLMYLTEAIVDTDGTQYPMVGIFPTRARMRKQLTAIGYVEVEGISTSGQAPLPQGETARGHQFRYSEIDPVPETVARSYHIKSRGSYGAPNREGYVMNNCLASYVHLHFLSNPEFAARWVDGCRRSNITTQAKARGSRPPGA
ncbi:MAG TPA: cobyrinate a,c-diamide synthase [Blastocatellia bacterium]|jgi:cobyrinic acid a,c-diamide synthase|nr:cobyrinate a,c-diamide synthase [Blastocatellia bacterium]